MSRTPTLLPSEAEALLGPRGSLRVDRDNRATVRKWVVAQGFPAAFVAGLSYIELAHAYNKLDGSGLDAIRKKLNEADIGDDAVAGKQSLHLETKITDAIDVHTDLLPDGSRYESMVFGGKLDGRTKIADTVSDARHAHHALVAEVRKAEGVQAPQTPADAGAELPLPTPTPAPQNAPAAFPVASPSPQSPPNAHDSTAIALLRDLLLNGYKPGIDRAEVTAIVQEQLAGIAPRVIEIKHDDKPPIKIEGLVHPEFERALRYLQDGANIMLVGPAGSGKTTMGKQLAKALGSTRSVVLSGSAGVSESEITGWLLPVEGGKFEYCPSQFVTCYEQGDATIIIDEIDGFDGNVGLRFNVPLANGSMYVQQRRDNPLIKRGENVHFIATANTYGTGANPIYVGRNPLDEATRDRFIFITCDYDKRLEESIGAAGGLTAAEMAGIWELRDRCREAQLRRVISTRAFQKAAIMKRCGDSWREIRDRLLEGWSKDEKSKVGV